MFYIELNPLQCTATSFIPHIKLSQQLQTYPILCTFKPYKADDKRFKEPHEPQSHLYKTC